ncbi:ion channel [Nocardiopsis sp. Huas11]|uniref:potassium channel family protein n=1 Tax=Nocardiopsis sp. Huas11 TaxID=2183912 RepID=UPI000EB1D0B0|nr:potassium channel family protein [Nocardiopsis sp. Huas11]RKS06045.1 ion channel [Nocardiopsis sp. Huas11]
MGYLSLVGLLIMVLVICDAAITVLHLDAEGWAAKCVRQVVWRTAVVVGGGLGGAQRLVLGLAGPLIVAGSFVLWLVLLTGGFALAVWPMMATEFAAQTDFRGQGHNFVDAVYFAGGTVTVLGYGDLAPLSTSARLMSLFGAATGFMLFTGMATYAIEIINGIAERNRITLTVHDDTRDGDGLTMYAEHLALDGVADTRTRCRSWADGLRELDEMVHRYPLVAFTYRSHRHEYDPEPVLRHSAEAAVAALVASEREPALRTSAASLRLALERVQRTIATIYLGRGVVRRLDDPRPTERDHRAVAEVARRLAEQWDAWDGVYENGAPEDKAPESGAAEDKAPGDASARPLSAEGSRREAAETVYRSRIFLDALHAWARTDGVPHAWEVPGS